MFLSENVVNDLPRGLLDGFVRGIDDFPVPVPFDQVLDILDLGKDLFKITVTGLEAGMFLAHLPHFLEDLGVYVEADDLVLVDFKELLW